MATLQTNSKTPKGTGLTGKALAAAAKAAKAKGTTNEPKEVKAVIPVIKKGALSVDVGPIVIAGLAKAYDDEDKAKQLMAGVDSKRYDLLAQLVLGIAKAAKADGSIDLKATVMSGSDGSKAMGLLNDQLGLALGFKEVKTVVKGDTKAEKIVYSEKVRHFFPMPGEDKNDAAVQRKATLRSNFVHMLKKASMTALNVIERKIDVKMDKAAGTLLISGPEVKKQFGAASVHLNEKQTVKNAKTGEEQKLTQRPSFTALATQAAIAHGKAVKTGSNTRGQGQQLTNPTAALQGLSKAVVKACENIQQPNDKQIEALEAMQSAIETTLAKV